jgi:hypothetical protein
LWPIPTCEHELVGDHGIFTTATSTLSNSVMAELSSAVTVVTTMDPTGNPVGQVQMCGVRRMLRNSWSFGRLDRSSSRLSECFASRVDDKFDGIEGTQAPNGLPVLTGNALATAGCRLAGDITTGYMRSSWVRCRTATWRMAADARPRIPNASTSHFR